MIYSGQVSTSFFSSLYRLLLVAILFAVSCTVPRKYQAGKPFVYKTGIKINSTSIKLAEKQELETRLNNQLDDSLKVRIVSFAGIRKNLIRPAVFDTLYASRSVIFMNALMNSLGYYNAQITWDSSLKRVGKQQRVTIEFNVSPGKNLKMDSIGYVLSDTALQRLVLENKKGTLLLKNQPYSQQVVSAELDRLITVFRDHGYFKITKEDIYAEVDTVLAGLINPGLDPFEQVRLLNELKKRRENPTIDVVIKQRTPEGAPSLKKYYISSVGIYPDLLLFSDSSRRGLDSVNVRKFTIFNRTTKFKPRFLAKNSSLVPGDLYRLTNYYKTINTFSQLGAWQQVNIDLQPNDSLGLLAAIIKLYPARKQSLVIDLEATRNSGDVIATSNLFGIGLNVGLRNRNLARESIQSTTNIRGGIELGTKTRLLQTLQGSLVQNIYFPKFILPFKIRGEDRLNSSRTILNFTASYTDRRDFFTLGSINGSIGYEWTTSPKKYEIGPRTKNHVWLYIPFNIELVRLGIRQRLTDLLISVPNLRNSFNNGLIISQNLIYKSIYSRNNHFTSLKLGLEESGGILGLLKHIDRDAGLYRYVKIDGDIRHVIQFKRSEWAFRLYAGIGVPYGRTLNGEKENQLPFFKSFYAGGPNSMRAWQVRRLGIGSSIFYDTLNNGFYDRFGDIQIESNVEFRFNLATIAGIKVKSAFFADIGNVWSRKTDGSAEQKGADFMFTRLYKDIAVAAGTSLRFDFNYFLIRFDWAYKVKNPFYANQKAGWLQNLHIGDGQFQLGIGVPF